MFEICIGNILVIWLTLFCCSFAWLELVSHRTFMARLLTGNSQKGWPFFQRLLIDLFKFMEPYLRTADLLEPVNPPFPITFRICLVQVIMSHFLYLLCLFYLGAPYVQRNYESAACTTPWLSWISVWLSLQFLWRDPFQLHSNAQCHS